VTRDDGRTRGSAWACRYHAAWPTAGGELRVLPVFPTDRAPASAVHFRGLNHEGIFTKIGSTFRPV
jgi:hypothetical protein